MKNKNVLVRLFVLTTAVAKGAKTLPDTIELSDGQKIKISEHPALLDLVQKAQGIEKEKLYNTIAKNTELIEKLNAELNTIRTQAAAPSNPNPVSQQPASPQTPATPSTKEAIKDDLNRLNNEAGPITPDGIRQMLADIFEQSIPTLLKKYIEPIEQKAAEVAQYQITSYREQKLKELGDTVIPELVTGNTIAEIDASIEVSKATRSRYIPTPPTTPPATPPTQAASPITTTPAVEPPPTLPNRVTPEARPLDVKKLSQEEFAKKREDLLKELPTNANQYPQIN